MKGLKAMRKSVSSAKALVAKYSLPADPRTSALLSVFDEMLIQHNRLLHSCENNEFHDAIEQGRKLILNLYRGLWISYCATDAQFVDENQTPMAPRSAFRIAHEIDNRCRTSSDTSDLRKVVWSILSKYANFELEQISRRKTRRGLEPPYRDEIVDDIATTCTNCLLLLADAVLKTNGHVEIAQRIVPAKPSRPSGSDW